MSLSISLRWLTSAFGFVSNGIRAPKSRTKCWKLKGEVTQAFKERVIKEGPWEEGGDANNMWMKMAICIPKVASKFGVNRGSRIEANDTWWWK